MEQTLYPPLSADGTSFVNGPKALRFYPKILSVHRRPRSRKIAPITKHHRSIVLIHRSHGKKRSPQRQHFDRLRYLNSVLPFPGSPRCTRTQPWVIKTNPPTRFLVLHKQSRPLLQKCSTFAIHKRRHLLHRCPGCRSSSWQSLLQQK